MSNLVQPTTRAHLDAGTVEYRFEEVTEKTILILHGGHMHAGLSIGEEAFLAGGYSVLVVSRPGYGGTDLPVSASPAEFSDVVIALCDRLGIERLSAVVGISAGGPFATALAANHPGFAERVILQAAVGPLSWPDALTRHMGQVIFGPPLEKITWAATRALFSRLSEDTGLRLMLGGLSTLPGKKVVESLSEDHRTGMLELFRQMRSGSGFRNDLKAMREPAALMPRQPALVIHSRHDGSVPFAHALALHRSLPNSQLAETSAASHLIWFSPDWERITGLIRKFLKTSTT